MLEYHVYILQIYTLVGVERSMQVCNVTTANVCVINDGPLSSFQGRLSSASSFHVSLLVAIDVVVSLALCPQVVSQAPQHFRSSKTQATYNG